MGLDAYISAGSGREWHIVLLHTTTTYRLCATPTYPNVYFCFVAANSNNHSEGRGPGCHVPTTGSHWRAYTPVRRDYEDTADIPTPDACRRPPPCALVSHILVLHHNIPQCLPLLHSHKLGCLLQGKSSWSHGSTSHRPMHTGRLCPEDVAVIHATDTCRRPHP